MADTTVSNINEGKSNLITKTSSAITDIRRILNEPAAKRALPTALALIVTFVGIILFISFREPSKTTLFSSLSEADKSKVVESLRQNGINVSLDSATGEVLVPSTDYYQSKMLLAAEGLPESLPNGYDSLDNIIIPDSGNELIKSTEPEKVTDFEIGFRHKSQNLNFNINYYYLNFENERVLNGAFGPNGLALTSNVEKSTRTGIELSASYKLGKYIMLVNNSSYNYSIIKEQDVDFNPILTPPLIINQEVVFNKNKFTVSLNNRYQSNSYINFENTESINKYILLNGSINYQLNDLHITFFINNMTDNFYFNNGLVDLNGNNKYFVQAPRNYHVSLKYIF